MASTNKTTNYDLSQYVGSDKPSYLNDYNQDMNRIDLGIHAAKSEADTNATAIGDLSDLTTTAKTDLVSAINEVDSTASTANATAVQADGKANTNATAIGTLANLETTVKTNLVSATNEVNGKIGALESKFELTSFVTPTVTYTSDGGNPEIESQNIRIAKNSDGSVFKVYGNYTIFNSAWTTGNKLTLSNTGLPAVNTEYTINGAGCRYKAGGTPVLAEVSITYKTNGNLEINLGGFGDNSVERGVLTACLYFNANFGDTPSE